MIYLVIPILLAISFLLALRSLKRELEKPQMASSLQKELIKGKPLYLTK